MRINQTWQVVSKLSSVLLLLLLPCIIVAPQLSQAERMVSTEYTALAQWRFDSGEGEIAFDSSSHNNDGILTCNGSNCSIPQWSSHGAGSALQFDEDNNFVSVTSSDTINLRRTEWTITGWFKLDQLSSVRNDVLNVGSFQMRLFITNGECWRLLVHTTKDGWQRTKACSHVNTNKWVHLAGVWNRQTLQLYLNGSLEDKRDAGSRMSTGRSGGITIGKSVGDSDPFSGTINDVIIYQRSLSKEEITDLADDQ